MIYNFLLIVLSLSGPLIYGMDEKNNIQFFIVNDDNDNLSDSQFYDGDTNLCGELNSRMDIKPIIKSPKVLLSNRIRTLSKVKDKFNKLMVNYHANSSQFYGEVHELFEQGLALSYEQDPYCNTIFCGALNTIYPLAEEMKDMHHANRVLASHILSLAAYCDVHNIKEKPVFCFLLICNDYQKRMQKIIPKPIKRIIIDKTISRGFNPIMRSFKEISHRITLEDSFTKSLFNNKLNEEELSDPSVFLEKYGVFISGDKKFCYSRRFDFMNLFINYYKNTPDFPYRGFIKHLEEKNDLLNPKNWNDSFFISLQKINKYKEILFALDEDSDTE